MYASEPAQSCINNMGQMFSQPASEPTMANQVKTNGKRTKSRKSKNSFIAEQPLDPEQESARTLLQMRGGELSEGLASYNTDKTSSQPIPPQSSPPRGSTPRNGDGSAVKYSQKVRGSDKSRRQSTRERHGHHVRRLPRSAEPDEGSQYPPLPSTPPGGTNGHKPSPPHRIMSQSQHALDDVPSDDNTACFDQAFANGSMSAEPAVEAPNFHSFSQQPPNGLSREDSMYPTYNLPTHVSILPNMTQKSKKRKRRAISPYHNPNVENAALQGGAGQHTLDFDVGADDEVFYNGLNMANPFGDFEGYEMPIDPELHSMSALPPSVDLSALDDGDTNRLDAKKAKSARNTVTQPKKRRRVEVEPTYQEQDSFHGLNALHNQENMQDRVLPGIEDLRRQTSPDLGTPFIENIARGGLEYLDNASGTADVPARKGQKTKESKTQNHKRSGRSLKDVSDKGGPFASAEIAKLDNFRDLYCDANRVNHAQFNDLIQSTMRGNAKAYALFNDLHEVLPYRPRMSVQKFARRHFHNYSARGTWTADEDAMLRRAVAEKGKQWKVVGQLIDRMPGDCRDRWRNYLHNSEHRNREQWTEEEVRNLCLAILECLHLLKEERRRARVEKYGLDASDIEESSDQEVEDLKVINWQAVSDRMGKNGGGRSRLQCNFKWSQLQKKDQQDFMDKLKAAQTGEVAKPRKTRNPWRQVLASKKMVNMKTGDRYVFLQAILESNASTEGNIPWKTLGDDDFRRLWNGGEKKQIWSILKESVPGSELMDYREVVNRLLTCILAEEGDALNERWDPQVDGDLSQTKSRQSRKAKGKEREVDRANPMREERYRKAVEKRSSAKDTELIDKSGDQEENMTANGAQNYNYYSALEPATANMYAVTNNDTPDRTGNEGGQGTIKRNGVSEIDSLFEETEEGNGPPPENEGDASPQMVSKMQLVEQHNMATM